MDDRPAELFQLDRATCVALLTTQHVGRLVIGGEEPTVIPVNYMAADGIVTFRTEIGGTIERAASGRVAFEVDMFDDRTRSGWSVIVRGRLLPLPDGDVVDLDTWAPGERARWMIVPIDAVTGRLLRGSVERDPAVGGYL